MVKRKKGAEDVGGRYCPRRRGTAGGKGGVSGGGDKYGRRGGGGLT